MWGTLIVIASVVLAYGNSFKGAFVFDDIRTITVNPALERFIAVTKDGSPASGRPLVHLTFALNRAIGGTEVVGYHVVNLAIHLGAALALFGLVRRTLRTLRIRQDPASAVAPPHTSGELFAAVLAALWAVHPLQTEAVTYVSQRAESLCGFLFLFTLYAFARATESAAGHGSEHAQRAQRWSIAAAAACLAGAATKEVIVTAPLVALLYDRVFVSGSLASAWRRHRSLHLALLASWIPLAIFVVVSGTRAGSAGFGGEIPAWNYLLRQSEAILHYLRLAVWPHPLVFDYGTAVPAGLADVAGAFLGVVGLLGIAIALWRWRPVAGFFAITFFLLLAPSSSFVPVHTQTMAEHRMYLPLACLVVGFGCLLYRRWRSGANLLASLAVVTGIVLTAQRNQAYASPETLWRKTTHDAPSNARAWYNLGVAELAAGRRSDALPSFARAVALRPAYAEAQDALGTALADEGRLDEALPHLAEAVRLQPRFASAQVNLGSALQRAGRAEEAMVAYRAALQLEPGAVDAHFNLAGLLSSQGETAAALGHYRVVLKAQPDFVDARFGMANTLVRAGRFSEALQSYLALVRDHPKNARARTNLGHVYLLMGRAAEAVASYEAALGIDAADANARAGLAEAHALQGRDGN